MSTSTSQKISDFRWSVAHVRERKYFSEKRGEKIFGKKLLWNAGIFSWSAKRRNVNFVTLTDNA